MSSTPYITSVSASALFLLGWIWFFQPGITTAQGLVGVVLALVLRHIIRKGLERRGNN